MHLRYSAIRLLSSSCRFSYFFFRIPVANPTGPNHHRPGAGIGPKEGGDDAAPGPVEDALAPDKFDDPSESEAGEEPSE